MTADRSAAPAANVKETRPIQLGRIAELADTLLMARADQGDPVDPCGRAVFWVGAGTSVSAGIPSGRALAGRLAQRIAAKLGRVGTAPDCDDQGAHELAFAELQRAGKIGQHLTLGTAYGELFARLGAHDQRDFIRRVIVRTNRRQINWSHLAIGELVRQRVVHTLLTTNFDDLLLDGLVRCDQLPAIIDGVESLNRMDPQPPVPQLVYLHGSQHTYSPRNSTEAVLSTRDLPQAQGGLYGLLQHCSVLVIVGYAGNSGEGVMELLQESCAAIAELPIYWVAHGRQDSLSAAAIELLCGARNGRLIPGQDADLFFRELLREMHIGVPAWCRGPVSHLLHLADRIRVEPSPQGAELSDEVDDFRQRLRELEPYWNRVGAENRERRELRQLMLSDNHREVWRRLKDRTLDDLALLQMRAESAYELGRLGLDDTLERSVRDWSAVVRRQLSATPEWALAQDRLGDAHAALADHKHLERAAQDAFDAYEHTLTVHNREALPLHWACTRNKQGLTLLALLHLTGGADDMELAQAAQAAFNDALTIYRRDAMPTERAAAQRSLAHVLQLLGRAGNRMLLEQADATYIEVLQTHTRELQPADWALTACQRAVVMMELAHLGDGERLLRDAVDALRAAAQEVARESRPFQWRYVGLHHGAALLALGQRGDEAALRQAINVLRETLATPGAGPGRVADWAMPCSPLGGKLLRVSLGGDPAALSEVLEVLSRAEERLGGEFMPADQPLSVADLSQYVQDELVRVAARQPAHIPGMRRVSSGVGGAPDLGNAGSRVLVVEDSKVDRKVLEARLKQCINVELCVRETGAGALAEIFRHAPDLLILDLNLPDMQGGEVLACVRTTHPWLPVLLYSGDSEAMSRLQQQAQPGQSVAMLNKDCSLDEFKRLIPTLFKRRQRDAVRGQRVGVRVGS